MFRTKGTWPRTSAVYCHPVPATVWPPHPEIIERIPLVPPSRRGDRRGRRPGREQRSQIVFTRGRGREMVFWQSPRTTARWLEIADEYYAALPTGARRQVDERVAEVLEDPYGPEDAYDPVTDQWITASG